MSVITMIIIIATILYLHPQHCSTSFIHATVPGVVTFERRIRFWIMVEDLHGIVLYILDSERKIFGIEVEEGHYGERFVQIRFNKRYYILTLHQFCGCNHCERTMVAFNVKLSNTSMSVRCNSEDIFVASLTSTIHLIIDADGIGAFYHVPQSMTNERNATFIAIGNIGPILAPLPQQIVGCLLFFVYDNDVVAFIEEGSEMRRSCPRRCDNGTCNGGMCHPRYLKYLWWYLHTICDCSSTALNGLYCNKALRRYQRHGYNTYAMNGNASLKMSWNVSSPRRYCLLEVVRGDKSMTLVIEGDHLTANSISISRIDALDANFFHLDIRNDHYVVKTKYNQSQISSSLSDGFLVNIGFSERSADCRTLEGSYDLAMNEHYVNKLERMKSLSSSKKKVSIKLWVIPLGSGISLLAILTIILVAYSVIKERQSNIYENICEPKVDEVELM